MVYRKPLDGKEILEDNQRVLGSGIKTPEEFFELLWADFAALAPGVARLRDLFRQRGERVENDHVAFRTFNLPPFDISSLEKGFLDLGYRRLDEYFFPEKKLRAFSYEGPTPESPLIFFSELLVRELSPSARAIIEKLTAAAEPELPGRPEMFQAGRPWPAPAYEDYEILRGESEYAAWVAALGYHANHFTINVNLLRHTPDVASVLDAVESWGYAVNEVGGRVKGGPEVLLEQGSTMAEKTAVRFAGGTAREIPGCFYEFARRFPEPSGRLFRGFVAASADKIFESTWSRPGN